MKIAIFHELQTLSGARKMVDEYGKILKKNHVVDLYYINELEDKTVNGLFTNIFFHKFIEKKWKGKDWRRKLYKDTFELVNLYFLHKKIAKDINSKEYDLVFVNPSKYTQAPFILRFIKSKKIYFCQEPLRIVYDDLLSVYGDMGFLKKIYERLNRSVRKLIDKSNIKKSDLILSNSKYSKINIKRAYDLNSFVCYLGADVDKFKQGDSRKEHDILFIGEKTPIDGYDLLQKTLPLLNNKLNVKIISREAESISEDNLVREFNNSKIFLALSRNEPFGLAPIEAMACSVPVIALNEGGLRESVIDSKTGYLIDFNETELKNKIEYLLENEKIRKDFEENSRKHVLENFTWEKSVDRFMKIIEKNL